MNAMLKQLSVGLLALSLWLGGAPASATEWTVPAEPAEFQDLAAPPELPADWVTEAGPFVRVHGDPRHARLLIRLARHATEALPRLATAAGVPIGDTVHVVLASTDEEFRRLQPGRAPSWADATAYPSLGRVFLRAPLARGPQADPLEQVLEHELVHVLLGRAFAPAVPPDWLQEGLAVVLAREDGPEQAEVLTRGLATSGLLPLAELVRRFPDDPNRAQLAYAQSAHLVRWLQRAYGPESVRGLVRGLGAGHPIEHAMLQATGQPLAAVERRWGEELQASAPWELAWLLQGDWWFGLIGLGLVGAGLHRRRLFHQRMEVLAAEERLLDELVLETRARRAMSA